MNDEADTHLARKGRTVGLVIAGTMIVWFVVQMIAAKIGLAGRYAFLFDFAAIAALIWAMVVTFQIRRSRRETQG